MLADSLPAGWTLSVGGVGGTSTAVANLGPTQGIAFGFIDTTGTTDTSFTGVAGAVSGSTLTSPAFTIGAGQTLRLDLDFLTNDGGDGFEDFAFVQLFSVGSSVPVAMLYTANTTDPGAQAVPAVGGPGPVSPGVTLTPGTAVFDGQFTGLLGGIPYGPDSANGGPGGSTGWVTSSYTPGAGSYELLFVVSDVGDSGVPSALAIDSIREGTTLIEGFEPTSSPAVPETSTLSMVLCATAVFALTGLRRSCLRSPCGGNVTES
jgi:hypothetical protein